MALASGELMCSLMTRPVATPMSCGGECFPCPIDQRADLLCRMQAEHPADEANTVIMRGRVLGGLEPTRAFGDARYKWPAEVQAL